VIASNPITTLLEGAAGDPQAGVADLPLLSASERHRVIELWNETAVDYPREKCVHELFEAQVKRTPEAVAVAFEDLQLTYAGLNKKANRLAHYLKTLGVGPEARVGICLERSLELVIGLLGILKAGGAYVPLDAAFPAERKAHMMTDSEVKIVISTSVMELPETPQVTRINLDQTAALAEGVADDPGIALGGEALAYLMYTSGSTGKPKGIMTPHRAIGRTVLNCGYADFDESDRVAFAANPAFDASTMEIWAPLLNGGRIVVVDREAFLEPRSFAQLLERQGVTALFLTTAIFDQYALAIPETLARLRYLFCGGEKNDPASFGRVLEQSGPQRLVHCYGPTETTTYAATHEVREVAAGTRSIPLGRPISNTQIYILDANQQPTPIGVTGELYIGGAGVALGYLNRPELTAERFLTDPFTEQTGARMYKSGDLGCWQADGTIEFLGRNDFQVKIRGFRIELGEIEARLAEHADVGQAVVVMREDTAEDKRLVAYYTCVDGAEMGVVAEELRSHLSAKLPEYMVPAAYVRLERFPLTTNGKMDRRALPAPEGDAYVARRYEAPVGETETALARLWAELLGVEEVGLHDNLFELGGHSVLALRLISRLRKTLGVEVTVNELFANPVLGDFARVVAGAAQTALPEITLAKRGATLPLSFAQQRLWFVAQMEGASQAYNIPWGMLLRGELDRGSLRQALDRIVERHEALRTTFVLVGGEVAQAIAAIEESRFQLVEHDLRQRENWREELDDLIDQEERAAFDLQAGPLIRGRLIRLSEDEHTLLITMHHIVSDGWSIGLFLNELSALYGAYLRGEADPLPPLSVQYADYAVWQRKWIEGGILQRQIGYWKEALAGAPGLLELPADHPRPAAQNYAGASTELELDEKLVSGLKELSRRHGTTLFMTLLGGLAALLARLSGQGDIVIGAPTANRGRIEIEKLIGFFINTLPLRINVSATSTVGELLSCVKAQTLSAQQHQDAPFDRVVEVLRPERNLSHSPIFQVGFSWQNAVYLEGALELPGLEVRSLPKAPQVKAKFDLMLALWEGEAGRTIMGWLEYATSLFEAATIERYLGYFRTLLEGMVADDSQTVACLPLLSASERHQVIEQWNETAVDYPREKLIHELFEEQVKRTPEAVAVISEDARLSYGELNRRANQLAHHLRRLGVRPEVVVGICVGRSSEMIVGLLGILKAGGAYLPLDPGYPVERLRYMLEDTETPVVVTQGALKELLSFYEGETVCLDQEWEAIGREPEGEVGGAVRAENPAYVIYTSGSTGEPKGVTIQHRSLCNIAKAQEIRFGFKSSDHVLLFSSLNFDASVWEMIIAFSKGAGLYLATEEIRLSSSKLIETLRNQGITVATIPPSLLAVTSGDRLPALHTVVTGGDACPAEAVEQWGSGRRFFNVYGPTETTCGVTAMECSRDKQGPPIGRPMANSQIYILDERLQPVPIGIAGEIHIGGAGLARGYRKRPDQTAERFVPNPFGEAESRLYRTGDLGRWLADGTIEFLGRDDLQVKIRGYRIELGEIEARLAEHAGVGQAVVIARDDNGTGKRLVAYYTGEEVGAESLRAHLSSTLPEHMAPAAFVFLAELPLDPNGKLDRRALPAPQVDAYVARKYEAPVGETETGLAMMWAEMLGVEEVGRHDNFFELGGHSLLGMRLISRLRQTLGVEVSISDLFAQTNLASFAEHVINLQLEQFDPNKLADVLSSMQASNIG
jgi:amino acid adenylation domain-containing protein